MSDLIWELSYGSGHETDHWGNLSVALIFLSRVTASNMTKILHIGQGIERSNELQLNEMTVMTCFSIADFVSIDEVL